MPSKHALAGSGVGFRVKLGAWNFPSGNHVNVFFEPENDNGISRATCERDSAPPLSADDEQHYLTVVLPALAERVQEDLERACRRALLLFT